MIFAVAGLGIGTLCGWLMAYWLHFRVDDAGLLQNHMSRIVNIEAIEEHEKLVKLRMRRNRLRTMRVDGGPNAVIMPMRVRSRPRRGGRKDGNG